MTGCPKLRGEAERDGGSRSPGDQEELGQEQHVSRTDDPTRSEHVVLQPFSLRPM